MPHLTTGVEVKLAPGTEGKAEEFWERYGYDYGSQRRKYDLYLITDVDIPFVQDGTRDGEHIRKWMHNRFIELLKKKKKKFKVLSGSRKNRLNKAISLLAPILISSNFT